MFAPDGDLRDDGTRDPVYRALGGELAALDPWTPVDFGWMHPGAAADRTAIGYRALAIADRLAGRTVCDAGGYRGGAPFMIELLEDRLVAQAWWARAGLEPASPLCGHLSSLDRWAAGSLSPNLRVMRCESGDLGLEAVMHLAEPTAVASLREFVTAFSWDVAALHAAAEGEPLTPTEDLVRRAAVRPARSTPVIPLRAVRGADDWNLSASPRGVFVALQPGGALAESDNVLYAVRGEHGALVPLTTLPGHRRDWDCARLVDIWLARDGETCLARSLVCEGLIRTADGGWRRVTNEQISAVAPWGDSGFLLGLFDGRVAIVNGAQAVSAPRRIARVRGRFCRLVTIGDRAVGLVGGTLVGARVTAASTARRPAAGQWVLDLDPIVTCDMVRDLDADTWTSAPRVALLGDDALLVVDADAGVVLRRTTVQQARLAKWIGADTLLVVEQVEAAEGAHSRLRLLDVRTGVWNTVALTTEVARLAVHGDEVHVGHADQTIAVWDRVALCRATGMRGAA